MSRTKVDRPITSDVMHNENSFRYLEKLIIPEDNEGYQIFISLFKDNNTKQVLKEIYDLKYTNKNNTSSNEGDNLINVKHSKAGDLFSRFFNAIQSEHENLNKIIKNNKNDNLSKFISSIYNNDNKNLEQTYLKIESITKAQMPVDKSLSSKVTTFFQDSWFPTQKNKITPASEDGLVARFNTVVPFYDFTPQDRTNLPNVRNYEYKNEYSVKEYRFGTQGQIISGQGHVCPVFELWLTVQDNDTKDDAIKHIYFNNLALDGTQIERQREAELSKALHKLEDKHKIAVITLPSDKGLMDNKYVSQITDHETKDYAIEFFVEMAMKSKTMNSNNGEIEDFYISHKIWSKLFDNDSNAKEKFKDLLNKSVDRLGFKSAPDLTKAQQQAIWFDFIKFQLTDYIIEKLKPNSINFTCKDAIDRGGVSSAYYNLMKALKEGGTFSREEFDRALHAAPTMVKARGMNTHINRIWNAVDAYISNEKNTDIKWLKQWRTANCPPERASELLGRLVEQKYNEQNIFNIKNIIEEVKKLHNQNIGRKDLLLSVISCLPQGDTWDIQDISKLTKLANKLPAISPAFLYLSGCMLIAIGTFLSTSLVNSKEVKGTNSANLLSIIAELMIKYGEKLQEPRNSICEIAKATADIKGKVNNIKRSNQDDSNTTTKDTSKNSP